MVQDTSKLDHQAAKVAKETGFALDRRIYAGFDNRTHESRNVIYRGRYQERSAVLKVYDGSFNSYEGPSLESFNTHNQSDTLRAPKLFAHYEQNLKKGWLIMEHLPKGKFFTSPMPVEDKKEFVAIFEEYTKNFPKELPRPLTLNEQLRSENRLLFYLDQEFRSVSSGEANQFVEGKPQLFKPGELVDRFQAARDVIEKVVSKSPMQPTHGHFKPKEVFRGDDGSVYLTDFAHVTRWPAGTDLAFVIWSDVFMDTNWDVSYARWRSEVAEWLECFRSRWKAFGWRQPERLANAVLLDHAFRTILTDIPRATYPDSEKRTRLDYMLRLVDELLASKKRALD